MKIRYLVIALRPLIRTMWRIPHIDLLRWKMTYRTSHFTQRRHLGIHHGVHLLHSDMLIRRAFDSAILLRSILLLHLLNHLILANKFDCLTRFELRINIIPCRFRCHNVLNSSFHRAFVVDEALLLDLNRHLLGWFVTSHHRLHLVLHLSELTD